MREILISTLSLPAETLRLRLQRELEGEGIELMVRKVPSGSRSGADPTVLVAIVSGVSAAVSALISGLLRVLERRRVPSATIVVTGSDGTSVTVPAATDPERIEELLRLARELDSPRIWIDSA